MATITLEYNSRNNAANKVIEVLIAMNNVFKVKTQDKTNNRRLTHKAIQDVENGNVIICDSFDEYLKRTANYA